MFINKIKRCKAIDIESKLKDYVIKNYDGESLTEKIKTYFIEVAQNRNVLAQMEENQISIDQIKKNISIITSYLNQMLTIRQKMTFGRENFSCKIEFEYNDTIKDSNWDSYNIWFEIYNTIFNLAVLYYRLGEEISKAATEKNGRKDANVNFKYALYLFELIKKDATTKLPEKDLPIDLYPSHMDYCITLCQIKGQIEIFKIAKETGTKGELLQKILHEISNLYFKAKALSEQSPTKKGTSDSISALLENRAHYYKGLMYRELREDAEKKFNQDGMHWGEMVTLQGLFVQELTECEKTMKKCSKYLNVEKFNKELEDEKDKGADYYEKNQNVYKQAIPEPNSYANLPSKNMMIGICPNDLYINENAEKAKSDEKIFCSDLELLIPKEVKAMINNYKTKMNDFITSNLEKYENEGTIKNFIQNLFLPPNLTKKMGEEEESIPPREFPPQLWGKIEKVQQIGGTMSLKRIINGILTKSNYLVGQLNNFLNSLQAEDKDDAMCRQRFQNRWIREPSIKLNFKLLEPAKNFLATIQKTSKYDKQEQNDIETNAKYYDILTSSREQLIMKIPNKEGITTEELPEEKEIKMEIGKLYELSDKIMSVIKPIYAELNDDSVIVAQFIEVLSNKTTEQAIFEKFKEIYESKFAELQKISDEVKKQEDAVSNIVQKNSYKIRDKPHQNISKEAMNYFKELDQYANMFLNKYEKLKKGDNYYNGLNDQIKNLIKAGNDWMIKRSDEKNALMVTLIGKNAVGNTRMSPKDMLNPNTNPYTHFNVPNINSQGNYGRPK